MTEHLIHIGWPKAGSTFLQEWFARHPELRYVPYGVAGFRSVLEMAASGPDDRFRYGVTSNEQFAVPGTIPLRKSDAGPPDPVHVRQEAVCTLLKTLFPGSRILIITRGFGSLLRSGHSQAVRMGLAMSLQARLDSYARVPGGGERHHHFDYVIGLYRAAFGADNVIVLPFELIRDDEARFLSILEERLGLSHAGIRVGRVNESLTPEELYWYPQISRVVSGTASVLGERAYRAIYHRYVWFTLGNRLKPLIRALSWVQPGRRVTEADFPPAYGHHCRGNADSLRGDPLYAPYAAEYLWTEADRGSA